MRLSEMISLLTKLFRILGRISIFSSASIPLRTFLRISSAEITRIIQIPYKENALIG